MTKQMSLTAPPYHEGLRRQKQQSDTEERMDRVHSITPSSSESVTHQVNAAREIQVNDIENGTQIVTDARHVYAESVPESSVTENVERDVIATEDSKWEAEDACDAISDPKKSASHTSLESTVLQSRTSAGIQNNNNGNGTQFNTLSSQGDVYTLHSGGHEFDGVVRFGPNAEITFRSKDRGSGQQFSYVVRGGAGIQNIYYNNELMTTGGPITGDVITIDNQGIHVHTADTQGQKKPEQQLEKASDGSVSPPSSELTTRRVESSGAIQNNTGGNGTQFNTIISHQGNTYNTGTDGRISGCDIHVKNGTGNKVCGSTGTSEVMIRNNTSNGHRGWGDHSGYVVYGGIYNTGGGSQINGPVYSDLYF